MKTITLDEVAYTRLKAWKRSEKDSFSSVIKRVLPESGTMGAFLNFVENRPRYSEEVDALLESSIEDRSSEKNDPWI